jgi:transposase
VVLAAVQGMPVEEIAAQHHVVRHTVYVWLHRCEQHGIAGLKDAARTGRPAAYTHEQVSQIIATALAPPQTLSLPFSSWTLGRLVSYLDELHVEDAGRLTAEHGEDDIAGLPLGFDVPGRLDHIF